jgi:hypothetical protein
LLTFSVFIFCYNKASSLLTGTGGGGGGIASIFYDFYCENPII